MSAARDNWVRMAVQYLRVLCPLIRHKQFTCEQIADMMADDSRYPLPTDRRWWGHAIQQAQDEGVIRKAAGVRQVRSRHYMPVWRAR